LPADATVQVLLATFNGERFLREQIDSILEQTYPSLEILACDDGSSDTTPAVLAEYATRYPAKLKLLSGAPTGSPKTNFQRLMRASTAPCIAFADQDDIWLPQKLAAEMQAIRALEQQHGASTPLLVFSDLEVVDSELRPLNPSLWKLHGLHPENIGRLERVLMQNVVTGCTVLANRPLVDLAREIPEDASMHDWWIALVACVFGRAQFLRDRLVRYRQHSGNALGAEAPVGLMKLPRWRDHTLRSIQWTDTLRQARAFHRTYRSQLPPAALATLQELERIDASQSRTERLWRMFRNGFLLTPLRPTLAIAWYLWDR
jgi:glycosyltransferase involved in cell wall biosynthesis